MLTFLVVASKGSGPLDPDASIFPDNPPDEIPIVPDESISWRNEAGTVAFVGWQATLPLREIGAHWSLDGQRLTAFSGHLWPRHGLWSPAGGWARQLADRLDRVGIENSLDDYFGVFSVADLHRVGSSTIFADPFGAGVLYFAEDKDRFIVSNRASLVARLLSGHQTPPRDALGVGWLCYFNHVLGTATSYQGVAALQPGAYLRIDSAGRVEIVAKQRPLWNPGSDVDPEQLATLAFEDLMSNVESTARLSSSRRIFPLSGGKDSRLILSLALAAGVRDSFEFETNGDEVHPDVIVGRELAERLHLRHLVNKPGTSSPSPQEYFERLRLHAFHTSGMLGATYLRGGTGELVDHVTVGGMFGEVMRSHYAAERRIDGRADLDWFFAHEMPFDAAAILRPEVKRHYSKLVSDWISEQLDSGAAPADVPDIFYLRHRIQRWVGTIQELHTGLLVHPLQSTGAVRWAFAEGANARRIDGPHFRVMRSAHTAVSKIRFAEDVWHEDNYRNLADAEDYRRLKPCVAKVEAPPRGSTYPSVRTCIKDYLLSDPSHPVFEVIDRKRLEDAVQHPGRLPATARIALYAVLGIGVWLGQDEKQAAFNQPSVQLKDGEFRLDAIKRSRSTPSVRNRPRRLRAARLLFKHAQRRLARTSFVRLVLRVKK